MKDPAHTQVELAEERTHAAWVRTCLTFLVTALAFRHYADSWWVSLVLAGGGAVAALRASWLAPDLSTRALAWCLIPVSLATVTIPV